MSKGIYLTETYVPRQNVGLRSFVKGLFGQAEGYGTVSGGQYYKLDSFVISSSNQGQSQGQSNQFVVKGNQTSVFTQNSSVNIIVSDDSPTYNCPIYTATIASVTYDSITTLSTSVTLSSISMVNINGPQSTLTDINVPTDSPEAYVFLRNDQPGFTHAEGQLTAAVGSYSHAEGQGTTSGRGCIYNFNSGFYVYNSVSSTGTVTGFSPIDFTSLLTSFVTNSTEFYFQSYYVFIVSFTKDPVLGNYTIVLQNGPTTNINVGYFSIPGMFGSGTHAEGYNSEAFNLNSHAEGIESTVFGKGAHSEGQSTAAIGQWSHAEGMNSQSIGLFSHAEGSETITQANASHAEGQRTTAISEASHSEGLSTTASGTASHSEGVNTIAGLGVIWNYTGGFYTYNSSNSQGTITGVTSYNYISILTNMQTNNIPLQFNSGSYLIVSFTAAGRNYTIIIANGPTTNINIGYLSIPGITGSAGHSEGVNTTAFNDGSHSEGISSMALGDYSHTEGQETVTQGNWSHAEGLSTVTLNDYSHSEGYKSATLGLYSHSEGRETVAVGNQSHAEGYKSVSTGLNSHSEGLSTKAAGNNSHAEGLTTIANGESSHSEGMETQSNGTVSHAEGMGSKAIGNNSHAEGYQTTASGLNSHSEGDRTTASGSAAHSSGSLTVASGNYSDASGISTQANGTNSVATGYSTIVNSSNSFVGGSYATNSVNNSYLYVSRNGNNNTINTANSSSGTESYTVVATGGINMYSGINSSTGQVTTGVSLPAGATSWNVVCDKTQKTQITSDDKLKSVNGVLNNQQILDKFNELPVELYYYNDDTEKKPVIGTYAQDVNRLFGLGTSTSLSTMDIDGISLAVLKSLVDKINQLTDRIAELESKCLVAGS